MATQCTSSPERQARQVGEVLDARPLDDLPVAEGGRDRRGARRRRRAGGVAQHGAGPQPVELCDEGRSGHEEGDAEMPGGGRAGADVGGIRRADDHGAVVVTLCGIVTRAPCMLVIWNRLRNRPE